MSQDLPQEHISKKVSVYRIPGMDAVNVRRAIEYRVTEQETLTMDVYSPPDATSGARLPAVVIVAGYSDVGYEKMLDCRFKDMGWVTSCARLIAASGMVAIAYANREPLADLPALLQHVRQNAASLGVDEHRIGLWAGSGNVPLALWALMQRDQRFLRCAVLCYGFTLDLDGSTVVADAAKQFQSVNPCAGKSVDDLPKDTPLFLARAGREQFPGLNDALDRFVAHALRANLPVTVVNHHTGPHAFDLFDDSDASREYIRQMLAFMRFHLTSPLPHEIA